MSWSGSKLASVFFCDWNGERPLKECLLSPLHQKQAGNNFWVNEAGEMINRISESSRKLFPWTTVSLYHFSWNISIHFCGCEEKGGGSKLSSQIRRFVVEKKKNKTKTNEANKQKELLFLIEPNCFPKSIFGCDQNQSESIILLELQLLLSLFKGNIFKIISPFLKIIIIIIIWDLEGQMPKR